MNCRFVSARETEYLDGALDSVEAARVAAHLEACDGCRSRIEELRRLQCLLGSLPAPQVPEYLKSLLDRRIAELSTGYRERLRSFLDDLLHPFRMLERRDLLIGLFSTPLSAFFFLLLLSQIYLSFSYPASISNAYILAFTQSTYSRAENDSMAVVAFINQEGEAEITEVIEYPHDALMLQQLNSIISQVKFEPAVWRGRRVNSYLVLSFSKIKVSG